MDCTFFGEGEHRMCDWYIIILYINIYLMSDISNLHVVKLKDYLTFTGNKIKIHDPNIH